MDIFKVLTRGTNIKSNSINRDYTKTTKKSSLEEDKELDFFHNQTKKKSTDQVAEDELIDDEDISMKDLLVKNHFNGKLIYNIDNYLLNVDKPTEIQSKSIKIHTENEDVDIIGVSPTGTGKTLAFIIPLVSKIIANSNDTNMNSLQSIIIAPTNDLAKQIFQVTENIVQGIVLNHKANTKSNTKLDVQLLNSKLSNKLLFESEDANAKLPQILISTPKRLISVLNKENTESILEHVKYFVIDEFDQLFSSDFIKQTEKLLSLFDNKSDVSKWMYSATKPEDKVFNNIIKNHMNQPELIECKYSSKLTSNIVKPKITESLVFVGNEQGKLLQLRQLQQNAQFIPPMLIFLESHARCMALYNELKYNSIPMATLHSKMTINEREKVINDFKEGKVWVIITTDIMARGLDINGIRTVINYDIPKNKELYIHRLGRVGRGLTSYNSKRGNKKIECECITLYSKIDAKDVVPIAKVMRQHGAEGVPDWLVEGRVREEKKKGDRKDDNKLKREKISTVPGIIRKERRMKKEMIDASKKRKQEGIVRPPKKQKKAANNA